MHLCEVLPATGEKGLGGAFGGLELDLAGAGDGADVGEGDSVD